MRFAFNRPTDDDPSLEPTPQQAPPELAAVELLLADEGRRMGWIDTQGQRTSDWLNANPEMPIRGLGAPDAAAASPAGEAQPLERERIVWVVPPPLPANRHLRLHRRRVLVHLELDDHEVSGQAHVRPGADAVDQVLRGTRDMVPLTDAQVVSRTDPTEGISLPVLIVNRRHVRRIVEDTPHISAPVPDPADRAAGDGPVDPRIVLLGVAMAEASSPPVADPVGGAEVAPAAPARQAEPGQPAEREEPAEPSGIDLLNSALTLLLEAGVVDVVEFHSIRSRIPTPPTSD